MKMKALFMGILLLFIASVAPAAIITLNQSQLLDENNWIGYDDISFFPDTRGTNWSLTATGMPDVNSANGVFYTSFYYGYFSPFMLTFEGYASDLSLVGQSGEGFGFLITNWNNQIWNFQVSVDTGDDTYSSPWVPIASSGIQQGIPGDTKAVIAYFGDTFEITDDFTLYLYAWNPSGNDSPHFEVNPVPEPGTMMLLGSGLIGLAGWGRKKFRK